MSLWHSSHNLFGPPFFFPCVLYARCGNIRLEQT